MKNEEKYIEIQNSLRDKLDLTDKIIPDNIKTIAGVDLAYWNNKDNEECAVCCIVVIDYRTHEVIERKSYAGKITCEYIPGFLSFREIPLILETVKLLENEPDIYMFDGNGYLHPRHMGIASQVSFDIGKTSIGVAKSYYKIEDTNYKEPGKLRGESTDIVIHDEVYGCVLRTMDNVKPVFVSAGNYISLKTSIDIVLSLIDKDSHIPVPTREADLETHKKRTECQNTGRMGTC